MAVMRMKKQESFSNSIQLKSNVVLKNVLIFLIIQPVVGVPHYPAHHTLKSLHCRKTINVFKAK
jgi:hypothetical protein